MINNNCINPETIFSSFLLFSLITLFSLPLLSPRPFRVCCGDTRRGLDAGGHVWTRRALRSLSLSSFTLSFSHSLFLLHFLILLFSPFLSLPSPPLHVCMVHIYTPMSEWESDYLNCNWSNTVSVLYDIITYFITLFCCIEISYQNGKNQVFPFFKKELF